MQVVYTPNERGELVDAEGNVLGVLVGLILEVKGGRGVKDVDVDVAVDVPASSKKTTRAEIASAAGQEALELGEALTPAGEDKVTPALPAEVQNVWDHYEATIATRKRKPNAKEIRLITKALELRELTTVKDAITGLSRSPFHNGENDRETKYLAIRYALSGNQRTGETAEERIDSMAELAHTQPTSVAEPRAGVSEGRADALKKMVLSSWRPSDRPQQTDLTLRDRAIAELESLGIRTRFRDDDGWPEFEQLEPELDPGEI